MTQHPTDAESCPETAATLRTARAGRLDEGRREHLAHCTDCREALIVDRALAEVVALPVALPAPGALRLRARLRIRDRAEARAGRWHRRLLIAALVASGTALVRSLALLRPGLAAADAGFEGTASIAGLAILLAALLGVALLGLAGPRSMRWLRAR